MKGSGTARHGIERSRSSVRGQASGRAADRNQVQELEPSIGGRWTSSRLRLSALLLLLGLCVLVLLESNGPISAPRSGGATEQATIRACAFPAAPPLPSVDINAIVRLHDELLPVMA